MEIVLMYFLNRVVIALRDFVLVLLLDYYLY